jgi:hypothetical protein
MIELPAIGGDNPGNLLTAMLKGIEAQIGKIGRFKMIINPKDAAHGFLQFTSLNSKFEYRNPRLLKL